MGNPYLRFLSLVDPDEASVDFHELRGGTPNQNITYNGLSEAALSLSSSLSDESLGLITKFIPAMLALVAFNSLVIIICCIVWLVSFIRKRRVRAIPRLPRSRTPRSMPMDDTSSYIARDDPISSSSTRLHAYEPVSMALSEDTFVLPAPAFYSESSKLQRPTSSSSTRLHAYEPVSMALSDDTFVPPTPAFHSESGKMQRPKSFG
jgi:saccharopepsin